MNSLFPAVPLDLHPIEMSILLFAPLAPPFPCTHKYVEPQPLSAQAALTGQISPQKAAVWEGPAQSILVNPPRVVGPHRQPQ